MRLLALASILVLIATLTVSAADQSHKKPNFVIIFMDDMGYADIGPFGATKQRTPHLDRMAKEGVKLTSFYAAPVCSVSRAQILTGCYGPRVSVTGVYFAKSGAGLNPSEFTIADRLKELGYATMCIGKWHLGDQVEFLPTRQGFDSYFGIPYSNDMLHPSAEGGPAVVPLLRNEKVEELVGVKDQSLLTQRFTEEAVSFITKHKDQPFLLYLPHFAVHTPIAPNPEFAGKSQNGRFGDWVEEVDASTGRILDTLTTLKLANNTLVVFTSDNGPWAVKGKDAGSAAPLSGSKFSTQEGGVRVPTLAWWPGRIPAGKVCDVVAGTVDLLPTCVALAGSTVPATPIIDGKDISSLLFGTSTAAPREAHYYFKGDNVEAVRQGPWKLTVKGPRLYNLDEDIGEKTDIAEKNPQIVERLLSLAKTMGKEIDDNRRPAGKVKNPQPLYPMGKGKKGGQKEDE